MPPLVRVNRWCSKAEPYGITLSEPVEQPRTEHGTVLVAECRPVGCKRTDGPNTGALAAAVGVAAVAEDVPDSAPTQARPAGVLPTGAGPGAGKLGCVLRLPPKAVVVAPWCLRPIPTPAAAMAITMPRVAAVRARRAR